MRKLSALFPDVGSSADGIAAYLKAKAKKLSLKELYASMKVDKIYVKLNKSDGISNLCAHAGIYNIWCLVDVML